MPDTLAMLAASLSSAAVGYITGLIVGRDTRPQIRFYRKMETRAVVMTGELITHNGDEPQVIKPTARRGSVRGSSPDWVSISQDRPPDNEPLYATTIQGLVGWYYCSTAYELPGGRLHQTRSYGHGHETVSWIAEPGEWTRCR